jgi:hypothetical protein
VSAAAYRARSATELIDATFQILRRNAAPLFTLAALFAIPNAIAAAALLPATQVMPTTTTLGATFGNSLTYLVVLLVISAVTQTAMILASSDAYLGRPVDAADAVKRALPKALIMFVAYILTFIAIGIGFIFFIVPGTIVALAFFAVPCVIAIENADIGQAFSRSNNLSKGLKGHIFVTYLLGGLLVLVGSIIITVIANMGRGVSPTVQLIVQALLQILLVPIFPLIVTLVYYDARIRKEGYDIELMAQQVAGAPTPQPARTPAS